MWADTHSNEQILSWETVSCTCRCSPAVLQRESREFSSPHTVPEGTNEGEFCFSFESLLRNRDATEWCMRAETVWHYTFILTCNNFSLQCSSLSRALFSFLFSRSFSFALWIDLVLLSYTPAICFSSTSISFTWTKRVLFFYIYSHSNTDAETKTCTHRIQKRSLVLFKERS